MNYIPSHPLTHASNFTGFTKIMKKAAGKKRPHFDKARLGTHKLLDRKVEHMNPFLKNENVQMYRIF